MSDDDAAAILELERRALDRWAQGDTAGYIANYADDVNACEQNAHCKRRLCGEVHDRQRDVQACVRDATFIPPFAERGPGSDQ
jgi:hypothetical protein